MKSTDTDRRRSTNEAVLLLEYVDPDLVPSVSEGRRPLMKYRLQATLKALAILAGVLVTVALGAVFYVVAAWDRATSRPVQEMQAPRDAGAVARGDYLYNQGMLCWTCHGSRGRRDPNEPQAGGRRFDLSNQALTGERTVLDWIKGT